MKLTESELKQIIKEEIDTAIEEGWLDRVSAKAQGWEAGLSQKIKAQRKKLGGKLAGGKDVKRGAHQARSMRGQAAQIKKAKQTQVIVGNHLKRLKNDLEKLGLDGQQPVKTALGQLEKAVEAALNAQPDRLRTRKTTDFGPKDADPDLLKQPFQFPGSK